MCVSWAAGGTCVGVIGRWRDLSWCRGRNASTAGEGNGGSYPWCRGPPTGPV